MATSAYLKLVDYSNTQMMGTSQVAGHEHEIDVIHWSWGADQSLNIASQSVGASVGKVTFRTLHIQKLIDTTTPPLFGCLCSGSPFKDAIFTLSRPLGGEGATATFFTVDMKLAAIKSITYSEADDPTETIEFECGGAVLTFVPFTGDGNVGEAVVNGWNRVKNISFTGGDIN